MSRDAAGSPERLRSSRSREISAARAVARQRRAAIAAEFRVALLAELGPNVSATATALVNAAVSANTEITELSTRFLACNVDDASMERLGAARGQLARILRALGLPRPTADSRRDGGSSALADYLARRAQAQTGSTAGVEIDGEDADGQR